MTQTCVPLQFRKRGALAVVLALVRGARPHTPMHQLSTHLPRFSASRLILRFGLAYELLREAYSVPCRIAEMHNREVDEQGWKMTWIRAFPENQRDALIQAHNLDIQNLRMRRPWMTGFDVALYLEGIEAGALLQSGTVRTEESRIPDPLAPPNSDNRSL